MKDQKKTMTLEEADKAGYRIGEAGQSGRTISSFQGYQRKYPAREISMDTMLYGNNEQRNVKHLLGCHRYWPDRTHTGRTRAEWEADGFKTCPHCIERGPSQSTLSEKEWNKLPSGELFVRPEGWEPKAFSTDTRPSSEEVEVLVQETLNMPNGIQELQFMDPVATVEHFTSLRFFFPVENWLFFYKAYRATGDKRLLDKLLESARHYNKLATEFPSAAQYKARDPEGMPFMYSMAASARIILQLARKYPGEVSSEQVAEAETFLKTMISVLKPTGEGDDALDPKMGIPQDLADDFRTRAFNRSMNGIGTLAMMTAALQDLQALNQTAEYQPVIDRYRKVVQEYVKYWISIGDYFTARDGEKFFVYPYVPEPNPKIVDGNKIFKRAEDAGHYSHTLQGVMCLYESTPELGIDDDFMTAVANAVSYSSTVKVEVGKGGKKEEKQSGHIESPTQAKVQPTTRPGKKGHQYSPARERFYMLEAFRDGIIDDLSITLNESNKAAMNSIYDRRLGTLHAQYMKALRKDRSLIHLGKTN
jgi:hypothetical protein